MLVAGKAVASQHQCTLGRYEFVLLGNIQAEYTTDLSKAVV